MKNIAILGVSGRQSAIVWKLSQSNNVDKIYFIPGNILDVPKVERVAIDYHDWEAIDTFLKDKNIAYIVPDGGDMYADGVVDFFTGRGYRVFGPNKLASKIEHSKTFSKTFMKKYGIPTVDFYSFDNYELAKKYIDSLDKYPVVMKADGLVRGRGVSIVRSKQKAIEFLEELFLEKIYGDAGLRVVIEDFAAGPEVSLHVISDGNSYKILPLAQDHKPLLEGNKGPNTGGMGTYAPVDWVPEDLMTEIEERIVKPTFSGLASEGIVFTGLLFPGLMLTKDGPVVLEYNARFGAPESQSLMMIIESDMDDLYEAVLEKKLDTFDLRWKNLHAATIEVVSKGYPKDLRGTNSEVTIHPADFDGEIFLTGVEKVDGKLISHGARNASVCGYGETLEDALKEAYKGVAAIDFNGKYFRSDIGRLDNQIPTR